MLPSLVASHQQLRGFVAICCWVLYRLSYLLPVATFFFQRCRGTLNCCGTVGSHLIIDDVFCQFLNVLGFQKRAMDEIGYTRSSKENLNASKPPEHLPDRREDVKTFTGRWCHSIGCKDNIFPWHLIGFPDGGVFCLYNRLFKKMFCQFSTSHGRHFSVN